MEPTHSDVTNPSDGAPTSPSTPPATLAGGKYVLQGLLGRGAMGEVYEARHTALQRKVAIKLLHPAVTKRPQAVERFRREALAASRIEHRHSTRVLDFGDEDGTCYIVMELLDGASLGDVVEREGQLSLARAVRLMSQVLSALAVAHDAGIVHRDLKPDNVVVVRAVNDQGELEERAKVCDFGIAKLYGPMSSETLTQDGSVSGTPHYMSPEQCQGHDLDARSDLYACGVMLFRLLVGAVPFTGDNPFAIVYRHVTEQPPRPTSLRPDLPNSVDDFIAKALAKAPKDRFQDARAMRRGLLALVGASTGPESPLVVADAASDAAGKVVDRRAWVSTSSASRGGLLMEPTRSLVPQLDTSAAGAALAPSQAEGVAAATSAAATPAGAWAQAMTPPMLALWVGGAALCVVGAVLWWRSGDANPVATASAPAVVSAPALAAAEDPAPRPPPTAAAGAPADRAAAAGDDEADAHPGPTSDAASSASPDGDAHGEALGGGDGAGGSEGAAAQPAVTAAPKGSAARADLGERAKPAHRANAQPKRRRGAHRRVVDRGAPSQAERGAPKAAEAAPSAAPAVGAGQAKAALAPSGGRQASPTPGERPAGSAAAERDPKGSAAPQGGSPAKPAAKAPPTPAAPASPPKPAPRPFNPAARIGLQALKIDGGLSKRSVSQALAPLREEARACWLSAARAANVTRRTTVSLRFTVDEDGRFRRVVGEGGPAGFARCVAQKAGRLRSHARPDTGTVDVRVALVFTP